MYYFCRVKLNNMMTPEQKARQDIDAQLIAADWVVQDFKNANLMANKGVAIREFRMDTGEADYALFVDGKLVGIIEAKEANKGESLSVVEEQTVRYATSSFKWKKDGKPLPLLYESTGTITQFTNLKDPKPRAREVFNFHRPET